jgi:hypothetical protein
MIFVLHFLSTTIITEYIGRQVGSQIGAVVADGLIEVSEQNDISKTADIYEEMKLKSERIAVPWKTASFLISLPIGPIINYLEKPISQKYILIPMSDKKITREQTILRLQLRGYLRYFVNSFAFCLILYVVLRVYSSRKTKV